MKKGNIISDGTKVSIIYKYSESDFSNKNYALIGNFNEIDKLIEIVDNTLSLVSINLISSCISTIVSFKNTIIIDKKTLTFQLFSRKTLPFSRVPYLYFHNNNYELSRYCSIENNKLSISCTFDKKILELFKGISYTIVELIPGCELPIDTGITMKFDFENCEKIGKNAICQKCFSGYDYVKNENICKKRRNKHLYNFLIIGLPIIWFFSFIISSIIICPERFDYKSCSIIFSFFFGPIALIINIIIWCK